VVLKRCQFFNESLKWNLTYLAKALVDEYAVYISNSRKFLYYDSLVDYQNYRKAGWSPSYQIQYKNLEEFLEIASELNRESNGTHAYLQVSFNDFAIKSKYQQNFVFCFLNLSLQDDIVICFVCVRRVCFVLYFTCILGLGHLEEQFRTD
jgi:hypothetical protein